MLNKSEIKEILNICLSTGGDFAELYFEDTIKNSMEMVSGKVNNVVTNHLYGCSIRILKGFKEVFGYTNDLSKESLLNLGKQLSDGFSGTSLGIEFDLKEEDIPNNFRPHVMPSAVKNSQKIDYLLKCYKGAISYSDEVSQVLCNIVDEEQNVIIYNTLGKMASDLRTHVRIACSVVAKDGEVMQTSSDSIGRNKGYDFFKDKDLYEFGRNIAKSAVTMLHADEMVGGKMTVVVHNAFGGVLLHEACVHSLEATSVAKGASVFCGKLGQKIASDIVTAIDDGTLKDDSWGSLNIDDEGKKTKRNVLIENGILKSYLVDYRNSRIMNHEITGSGRRQSYKFSPTSRMTNTFFSPGKSTYEEIISSTKYGLFAKKMGGGSVNPASGEFNFAVNEGYMIEDGKITKPVRGATLVGSGAEVLLNIDMIGNNLDFGHGMCGSRSGSIPTNVGQPTIRVLNMTVGGRGGK